MDNEQFKPYAWSLRGVIENNFYEIPIYQRPYSWESREVEMLLDDLFATYRKRTDDTPNNSLYVGQLFLRKKGKGVDGNKDKYEIVDGQQRLTTFSMILLSIYSISLKRGFKETDKEVSELKSFLWKYSTTNRNYNKDERLLTLSSIDEEFFKYIFDTSFDDPVHILINVDGYKTKCNIEINIKSMFKKIYTRVDKEILYNPENTDEILKFLSHLLDKTLFITIQSSIDMPHVFAVFESINSKGKILEEIDKIKTYIFSQLDETDYSNYLTKWGNLIINTNNELQDYLEIYVKAYLSYYRQRINLIEFKSLTKRLTSFYKVSSNAEAIKKLIDDMSNNVESYKILNNEEESYKLISNSKFKLYYKLFNVMNYSHPRALLFRTFCDFKNKNEKGDSLISANDVINVIKSSTLFMFKFQSIKGGDSKDAIKYFENITKKFYNVENISSSDIVTFFSNALITEGINKETIKNNFLMMDFYSKHTLGYAILSLVESIYEEVDKKGNIKARLLYSQAFYMLSHIKDKLFEIDHMLVQSPKKDDDNFKYYKITDEKGIERLCLKDGHDFPKDLVVNNMEYKEFESRTINKLGNIRLYLPELNKGKSNDVTHLPDGKTFTKYDDIIKRSEELADLLLSIDEL